jgi:hypothetical protein
MSGGISAKLAYLQETKELIRTSINSKGVSVTTSDTFRSYAGKISSISGSSTSFSPQKAGGLCFWLDGQCNTRTGNDHTKTYLENLCWSNTQSTTNGNLEYFTDTNQNTWDGDFLKLGTYAYYPYLYADSITIEAVVKVEESSQPSRQILTTSYQSGFIFNILQSGRVQFLVKGTNEDILVQSDTLLNLDTPYYMVATFAGNKSSKLCILNSTTNEVKETETSETIVYRSSTNMGLGTNASASTSVNQKRWDGLSIGMIRGWNRALTEEEIQDNYQDTKERFNF